MKRKAYLDNIRWVTVVLVMIYHVGYLFNNLGILGGIPNAKNLPFADVFCSIVYPWFMVLLFAAAGMSARYSLEKRTNKEFLRERADKLLVPSTLGLFVIHWVTGYLNIKMGGALSYILAPLVYPISVLSGIGPLWFIQLLFLFSCLLVLIRKIDKQDRLSALGRKTTVPVLLALGFAIWGASQILNMPVITTYRFGVYFAAFLIGYYVFTHDEVQERIEKMRLPMLASAIALGVAYGVFFYGKNYTEDACLKHLLTCAYLWVTVLAIFGCFKRYYDKETAFTGYMTKASFGWYILHYPVLLSVGYLLSTYTDFPAWAIYMLTLLGEFIGTFVLFSLLRRIPVVRYLTLGLRKKKK